jgi:hypothetical protein
MEALARGELGNLSRGDENRVNRNLELDLEVVP